MKQNDSNLVKELYSILEDESFFSYSTRVSITTEFKKICLKKVKLINFKVYFISTICFFVYKMANFINEDPDGSNSSIFMEIIMNQDTIEDIDLYSNYSNDDLFNDVRYVLKGAKYLKKTSVLKTVIVILKDHPYSFILKFCSINEIKSLSVVF